MPNSPRFYQPCKNKEGLVNTIILLQQELENTQNNLVAFTNLLNNTKALLNTLMLCGQNKSLTSKEEGDKEFYMAQIAQLEKILAPAENEIANRDKPLEIPISYLSVSNTQTQPHSICSQMVNKSIYAKIKNLTLELTARQQELDQMISPDIFKPAVESKKPST